MMSTPKVPLLEGLYDSKTTTICIDGEEPLGEVSRKYTPFVMLACNYHERLRDQLQAIVRGATEQELGNAMQLLAELAKQVQP